MELKAGTKLRSAVDGVEVIVVKAQGDVDLRCGGHPMIGASDDAPTGVSVEGGFDKGTLLGKRYVNESGDLEILATKAGDSSLSVGDEPLEIKAAKPLPSSD